MTLIKTQTTAKGAFSSLKLFLDINNNSTFDAWKTKTLFRLPSPRHTHLPLFQNLKDIRNLSQRIDASFQVSNVGIMMSKFLVASSIIVSLLPALANASPLQGQQLQKVAIDLRICSALYAVAIDDYTGDDRDRATETFKSFLKLSKMATDQIGASEDAMWDNIKTTANTLKGVELKDPVAWDDRRQGIQRYCSNLFNEFGSGNISFE